MTMHDLEQAFQIIDDHGNEHDFDGSKTEQLIRHAETVLGQSFPPTYRAFLARYGAGGLGDNEFYGVIHDDFEHSGIPDAIWQTLHDRQSYRLPHEYIIVGHDGYGGCYAIDRSVITADGESPVVEFSPGLPDEPITTHRIAQDFGQFMLQELRNSGL